MTGRPSDSLSALEETAGAPDRLEPESIIHPFRQQSFAATLEGGSGATWLCDGTLKRSNNSAAEATC